MVVILFTGPSSPLFIFVIFILSNVIPVVGQKKLWNLNSEITYM